MESGLRDSLTKLAFYDELVKISVSAEGQRARHQAKKWMKNTALIGAGAAGGTGLAMLTDCYAPKVFGESWNQLSRAKKIAILSPLVAAGGVAMPIIAKKLQEEKMRRMR